MTTSAALVECVPNFSEGRDAAILAALREAASVPGMRVLDQTADADHHRSVLTLAGAPAAVAEAAFRAVRTAVERIDLTRHQGVHPRLGAADVVPFVPLAVASMEQCVELAQAFGERVWRELGVPVYFYERAARRPGRRRLEHVRRGQFEGVGAALAAGDVERLPDIGGPLLHPTAGAVVVGARKVLVAWNVELATDDLAIAKAIASRIRERDGGLPGVKALGLPLAAKGCVQVSCNLTDLDQTGLDDVFQAVLRLAAEHNVQVAGSEIIGLLPRRVVEEAAVRRLQFLNFRPELVLETRLRESD